jgi:hypothetical protein
MTASGLLTKILNGLWVCWRSTAGKKWSLEKNSKQLVVCWKTDWTTLGHFKTDQTTLDWLKRLLKNFWVCCKIGWKSFRSLGKLLK